MNRPPSEFVKWMGPILDCLRELGGSAKPRQVSDWIADKHNIPDEQREATLKSGAQRFHNQVAWARQYLVWEGLLDGSKRGEWSLTPTGAKTRLTEEDGRRLFRSEIHARAHGTPAETISADSKKVDSPLSLNDVEDEEEEEANAVKQVESEIPPDEAKEQELLAVIQGLSPEGFERLCKLLLHVCGFENVVVTGKSHDGGVDGFGTFVINPFMSHQVAFQCKRYRGAVSRQQIASFRGSNEAARADKLIMITTGHFTIDAIKEAKGHHKNSVELVDGKKLVSLFEANPEKLGLRRRQGFDVDHAFFEQFRSPIK